MSWFIAGVTIAAFVYSLYMQSKISVPAPKPISANPPTASEGVPIPVVFGCRTITSPNVTWFGNKKVEAGDKTIPGGSNTLIYSGSFQLALCHGKIDAILDILYADRSCMAPPIAGNPAKILNSYHDWGSRPEEGIWGAYAVNLGEVAGAGIDPGVNDFMAQHMSMPDENGAAPTATTAIGPRYKGVAAIVVNASFGTSPFLRPCTAVAKRIHTRHGGTEAQWYDAKAEIALGTRARGDLWKYKLQGPSDIIDYSGIAVDDSAWEQGPGGIGNAPVQYDPKLFHANYDIPTTLTQLPVDGFFVRKGYPDYEVLKGTKLWLRYNLGKLPQHPLTVQCWHDDSGTLWFNGTQIPLQPVLTDDEAQHFASTAVIPKELISLSGTNVIAYRVQDSFDNAGKKIGTNEFIYAGLQVGVDAETAPGVVDMNPAHIIHEVLTDRIWGMCYNDYDLDDDAFRAAADTLYAEGLGMSFTWTNQMTIEDFLNDVLRHISGVLYVDRTTGLFVLKLIREDYNPLTIPVLGEAEIVRVEEATRKQVGELINTVTVTYSSTTRGDQGSVTLYDDGVLAAQGGYVSSKIDYPAISSPVNAAKLALRDLRLLSSPLLTCKLQVNRAAYRLNVGDPFTLNWPDLQIVNTIMRVTEISVGDYASGQVSISCVEDAFFIPTQPVSAPNDAIARPKPVKPLPPVDIDTLFTCQALDVRNKGMVEFVFGNDQGHPLDSPFANNAGVTGWVEDPVGVMTCEAFGPLTTWSQLLDGIDPFEGWASGPYTSWLVGRRVLVAKTGTGYEDQEKTGVYIIDDVGGYYDSGGSFVATKARMHRDPDFTADSAFQQNMIFSVRNGTALGGHYMQLATSGVQVGTTPMVWADLGTSLVWADRYMLLRKQQMAAEHVSPESSASQSVSYANGGPAAFPHAFVTLPGTPGTASIPAGPWEVQPSDVHVSGGDVGATTVLGFRFYASGVSNRNLFTLVSRALAPGHQTLDPLTYQAPAFAINEGDIVVCIPEISTTSTTTVTASITFNGLNAIQVRMPLVPGSAEVPAGTAWLVGRGAPSDGLGVDGDFYLDVDTGDVYEKVGGTWA